MKPPPEERNGYKDKERLAAIHQLPCVACAWIGQEQTTRTEAHHLIGYGLGKKASDLKTIPLCSKHHARGNMGEAIHETPLNQWESVFGSQEELLEITNELLSKRRSN